MKDLGDAWLADSYRSVSGLPPGAPALRKTVVEVDVRLRFLDGVKNLLSANQRQVVFPPATEGRLKLDLLSPVLVYVLSTPVTGADATELGTKLVAQLLESAGVKTPDAGLYADVGRTWVDQIPNVLVPMSPYAEDLNFPTVAAAQARARAQATATEAILRAGNLTTEQADALRAFQTLLFPYVPEA